jgi:competence protein ComEA
LAKRRRNAPAAFADGRGDERFQRVYAFVETADGQDVATVLVREGLARAYGVNRQTPWRASSGDYQESLRDEELTAASSRRGIWKNTNWEKLIPERQAQREEEAELAVALRPKQAAPGSINPNTASRDELMTLPGIGEAMATRIIEARSQGEYRSADDLKRVSGIGPKALETLTPYLRFGS